MAPINTPNGNEVSEIVLPNGNTASEVIAPDGSAVFGAIPDVGLDHFYWAPNVDDISADWPDLDGSEPATPVNSPSLGQINSEQAVSYDNTNSEYHETSNPFSLGSNGEYTYAIVFELTDTGGLVMPFTNGTNGSDGYQFQVRFDNDVYRMAHATIDYGGGGTPDSNPHVFVGTYDGSTVIGDLDGQEIINSSLPSPNTPSSEANIAGVAGTTSFNADGDVGAVGHEASAANASRRDELTDKLAEPFGISTST